MLIERFVKNVHAFDEELLSSLPENTTSHFILNHLNAHYINYELENMNFPGRLEGTYCRSVLMAHCLKQEHTDFPEDPNSSFL